MSLTDEQIGKFFGSLDQWKAAVDERDQRIKELERHNKALVERRQHDVADINDGVKKLVELEQQLEAARKDAERYQALKARHGYLMVVRLIGERGYSSVTKDAVIDAYADAAIADLKSVDAAELQRLFDAAISKEQA